MGKYLGSTVLSGTLGGRQLPLAVRLGGHTIRRRLLGLGGGLRSRAQHGRTGDGRVNVGLVARAGSVGLQVLLLTRSTLGARALEVVLRRQQLVMEH